MMPGTARLYRRIVLKSNHRISNCCRGLLLPLLILSGCSTLEPLVRQPDTAIAPADAPLWTDLQAVRGNDWYHLLNEGPDALAWRLRTINSATRSLDLQTFLWTPDPVGLSVMRDVVAAADRGVRVRILLDDTFTINEDHLLVRLSAHPRISVRLYNPYSRRTDSYALRELFNIGEFSRIDRRMHNKLMVVDNRTAILGGRNLADEYFGIDQDANFRDLEVIMGGPVVTETSELFDDYWNSSWAFPVEQLVKPDDVDSDMQSLRRWLDEAAPPSVSEKPSVSHAAWLQVARTAVSGKAVLLADEPAAEHPASNPNTSDILAQELLARIDGAEHEIVIVTAYLIPTPQLEAAIRRAAQRGVRIRILTNSLRSNNHTAAHSIYRGFIRQLMSHGADMHEVRADARDRYLYMMQPVGDKHLGLHAKLILIDDNLTFIGSANLDPRSLHLNTEMGILVDSNALNTLVRKHIAVDFSKRNAWHLQTLPGNRLIWVGDNVTLDTQPADSELQRLEDWFFGLLPIDSEM